MVLLNQTQNISRLASKEGEERCECCTPPSTMFVRFRETEDGSDDEDEDEQEGVRRRSKRTQIRGLPVQSDLSAAGKRAQGVKQ